MKFMSLFNGANRRLTNAWMALICLCLSNAATGQNLLQPISHEPAYPAVLEGGFHQTVTDVTLVGRNNEQDWPIYKHKMEIASEASTVPEKVLAVGLSFEDTPYVGGVLDRDSVEHLVINLRALDCWTFVENTVALALSSQRTETSNWESYQDQVRNLRYWGGQIGGYGSRIHYFSAWILQAEKLGILTDMTRELGGVPYEKKVHYMTAHRDQYPLLKDDKAFEILKNAEKRRNNHAFYYFPKSKARIIEDSIQDGDIIAITSSKRDLDISHQGIAVRRGGRVFLLHASSELKKVIVSPWPLAEYLQRNKGQSGFMVIRLKNP